jgi:hypothetical protein
MEGDYEFNLTWNDSHVPAFHILPGLQIQIVLYWRKLSGRTFSFRNGCTFVSKIIKSPSHMDAVATGELGLNCCGQVCNTTASSVGAVLLFRGYLRSGRRSCAVPAPLRIRHCAPSAALGSRPPRRRRRRIAPQRSRSDVAVAPSPPLHRRKDTGRRGATLDTPVRALRALGSPLPLWRRCRITPIAVPLVPLLRCADSVVTRQIY